MLLLSLLGLILLACYAYASTTPTLTLVTHDMTEAQAWADDLDASLCPAQRAVAMGLAPNPWACPVDIAWVILAASLPPAEMPVRARARARAARRTLRDMCLV